MSLLQRVAHARVAGGEHPVTLALQTGRIELQLHQLVHVSHHQHVAIELHHTVILDQREGRQLAPAIVEPWVLIVVFLYAGKEVCDALFRDPSSLKGTVALFGKGVGVERNEGVFATLLLERMIESEEAREVVGVGDEGCPYYRSTPSVSWLSMRLEGTGGRLLYLSGTQ